MLIILSIYSQVIELGKVFVVKQYLSFQLLTRFTNFLQCIQLSKKIEITRRIVHIVHMLDELLIYVCVQDAFRPSLKVGI